MNELPCEVVKDLLPSYLDGLTSEGTSRLVKEHLEGCRECADVMNAMQEPDAPEEEGDKATRRRSIILKRTAGRAAR